MTGESDSIPSPEERKKGRPRKAPLDPAVLNALRRQVGLGQGPSTEEPMEPSETPSDVMITGTVRLQPEQNFFDQPPFDTIISQTSQSSGVPDSALRFLLRRLIHHHQIEGTSKMTELLNSPKLHDLNSFFARIEDRDGYPRPTTRDAMRRILEGLQDYPEADVYIASHLKLRETYKNDGTYNPHHNAQPTEIALPPSYMSWWEERRERYSRLRTGYIMVAVEEVFPQDEIIPQDSRSATRNWRIRKASEIIAEQRRKHR